MDADDVKMFGPALKKASQKRMRAFIEKKMTGKGPVSRQQSVVKRRRIAERDIFG